MRTFLALWLAVQAVAAGDASRIVAVGDVHGGVAGLTTILREAALIDEQGHWNGGAATLIQLGDLMDRGSDVRDVLDLVMRLQVEASRQGGEVLCLLGNHEAMNLLGIARDVNPDSFEAFVDERSEKRRRDAFKAAKVRWKKWLHHLGLQRMQTGQEARDLWFEAHPLGKLEYLQALGAHSKYGEWLRSLPAVAVRSETLFVHGGLEPDLAGVALDDINRKIRNEIRRFDAFRDLLAGHDLLASTASISEVVMIGNAVLRSAEAEDGPRSDLVARLADELKGLTEIEAWDLVRADGPLWFRGWAKWDEGENGDAIAAVVDAAGVQRMVIGHTVQHTGLINSRFGGRVLAIDTGMLSSVYRGGRPSALQIDQGGVLALYPGERSRLLNGAWVPVRAEATSDVVRIPVPPGRRMPSQTPVQDQGGLP